MSAGTWGGRAIDPRVREAALEAARRHGLQLGGWLGDALQSHDSKEPLPALDLEDQDFSRAAGKRIAEALERLAQRIEAAEQRSSLAVVGLDRTVVGLASRIDDTEVGAREEALRLLALVGELKSAQDTLLERLARAEDDTRISELKSAVERIDAELARVTYRLDGDLARLAERLDGTGEAVAASIEQVRLEAQQAEDRLATRADAIEQRLTAFENLREQAHDALHDIEIALRAAIDEADARLSGRIAESSGAAFGRIEEIADRIEDLDASATRRAEEIQAQIDAAADSQAAALAEVEQRVSDTTQSSLAALDARMAETLADLRASVKVAADRAAVAETTADAAARALGDAAHALNARIAAVETGAAEAASRAKDMEAVFDARVADLATSVDSLRGALDAAFLTLRPEDIEAAVSDVNRRMAAAEGRQAQTIEAVSVEIKRLSEALDKRMRLLEDAHQKADLPKLIDAMQAQTAQRFGAVDTRAAETAAALAARFDALEAQLEAARADLRREIETTVRAVDQQLQARLDGALDEVDARLTAAETRPAAPRPASSTETTRPEFDASLISVPTPVPVREPTDIGYRDEPPAPAPAIAAAPATTTATTATASRWDELDAELDLEPEAPTLELDESVDSHTPLAGVHDPETAFDFLRNAPATEPLGDVTPGFDVGFDTPPATSLDDGDDDDDAFEIARPAPRAAAPAPAPAAKTASADDDWGLPASFTEADDGATAEAPPARRGLLDTDPDLDMDLLEAPSAETPGAARPSRPSDYLSEARRAAMEAAAPTTTRKGLTGSRRTLVYTTVGLVAVTGAGALVAPTLTALLRPADAAKEEAQAPAPTPQTPVSGPPGSIAEAAAAQAAAAAAAAAPATAAAAPKETLEQAVARGDAIALYELARRKLAEGANGEGFDLMKKAADKGLAAAQYRLAKLYERGEGAPADVAAARTWTERAALGGNRAAMHDLGVYFARGEGVQLNEAQAFRWFRQAADLGMTNSQFNLGVLYQSGRGVTADPAEALFWYSVAAAADDSDARARADLLSQRLDPSVVAQVRARATAFRPKPMNPRANGDFGPQTWAAPPAEAVNPGRT